MCIEYDRTPVKTYTHLLFYLCPLNVFFFLFVPVFPISSLVYRWLKIICIEMPIYGISFATNLGRNWSFQGTVFIVSYLLGAWFCSMLWFSLVEVLVRLLLVKTWGIPPLFAWNMTYEDLLKSQYRWVISIQFPSFWDDPLWFCCGVGGAKYHQYKLRHSLSRPADPSL